MSLIRMPSFSPLPEEFPHNVIQTAKCFSGYNVAVIERPAPDNRVQFVYQDFLTRALE